MIEVTLYKAKIEDYYSWGNDQAKFLKDQEKFIAAGFTPKVWEEGDNSHHYIVEDQNIIVDKHRLADLMVAGIRLADVAAIVTKVNIAEHLSTLAEKNVTLQVQAPSSYNTKCEVHMPGQALSMYNDMMLLENACTDELQTALNSGWRIIAACPQPDQRRPDYILGRFDPHHDVDGGAKR